MSWSPVGLISVQPVLVTEKGTDLKDPAAGPSCPISEVSSRRGFANVEQRERLTAIQALAEFPRREFRNGNGRDG
jgi:hypothetical protein